MCLNGRWRGFASATKRPATSMTDPGRADRTGQLLEMTACWSAPGGVDASDAYFVKNCTSDSCLQLSPRSYYCPETSAKQETTKKPCCVHQGPQPDGKVGQQMNRQLSFIPSASNIVDDPQGPIWTHSSPRRQSSWEVERLWFGVTSNTEVPGRSCKVDGNIDSAKYQQIIAPQYIPNYKRGQIFQQD